MARKGSQAGKREILVDPKYGDQVVSRFINVLMQDGKKSTSRKIVYTAFEEIQKRLNEDPLKVFKKALDNVKPNVEVRSRRVGGANYQIPIQVKPGRRQALAMRWMRDHTRARSEKTMVDRLSAELIEAFSNRGGAVKKKEDVHRMAEANQAFSHFQW